MDTAGRVLYLATPISFAFLVGCLSVCIYKVLNEDMGIKDNKVLTTLTIIFTLLFLSCMVLNFIRGDVVGDERDHLGGENRGLKVELNEAYKFCAFQLVQKHAEVNVGFLSVEEFCRPIEVFVKGAVISANNDPKWYTGADSQKFLKIISEAFANPEKAKAILEMIERSGVGTKVETDGAQVKPVAVVSGNLKVVN